MDLKTGFIPSWLVAPATDSIARRYLSELSTCTGGRIKDCDGLSSVAAPEPEDGTSAVLETDEDPYGVQPWREALSEGFAKKVRRHEAALSLLLTCQNFTATDKARVLTPAMAIGISGRVWTVADIADLVL